MPLYFISWLTGDGHSSLFSSVWSNFEIADMEFWRSEAYEEFFVYLESKGGFYYEVSSPSHILLSRTNHPCSSVGEMLPFTV